MKVKLLLIFNFCFVSLFAQDAYTLIGVTVDNTTQTKLVNMTVCVVNAQDSILQQFTYSDRDGIFRMDGIPAGNFFLLISYPDYADYVEHFTLGPEASTYDFGEISMKSTSIVLAEVMIKGRGQAIEIRGDTIEFNARSYVIQPNDKVEDLLRKLPGIQVDQNGKITAQNQTVSKVLLDGEEFFGDDPTLVTKNIRADMVDKVQLYDKKSDQAAFTGIDDGIKIKTINIKLKEDKKNGLFGKVNVGLGNDGYYEGQTMVNRFKGNKKYAAFGTIANNGKADLSYADNSKIGSGKVEVGASGLIGTSSNDDLVSYYGVYSGSGYPQVKSGGIHYDNKWGEDTHYLNSNYQARSIRVKDVRNNTVQQNLPSGLINSQGVETSDNNAFSQKANLTYRLKIDTSSNLNITVAGGANTFRLDNHYDTESRSDNQLLINRQLRTINNKGDQQAVDVSAYYTKLLKKPRRTVSVYLFEGLNQSQVRGYLYSEVEFYDNQGVWNNLENVDQYKTSYINNSSFISEVNYTEPLSKTLSLQASYTFETHHSRADRKSFDQTAGGSYTVLDTGYSSHYQFDQFDNTMGATISYIKGKVNLSIGSKANVVNLKQKDRLNGSLYERSFVDWAPRLYYSYSINAQRSFNLVYRGVTNQAKIDQLQPVKTNNDPLNILEGNPDLSPSFTHNFDFVYRLNNQLTGRSMYLSARYFLTDNAIATDRSTDPLTGKTISRYTNISEKSPYRYSLFWDQGGMLGVTDIRWSLFLNAVGEGTFHYINGALNKASSQGYTGSVGLSKYKQNQYGVSVSAGPNYSVNEFSLQPEINNNAAGFNGNIRTQFFLPLKLEINSTLSYRYIGETQAFDAERRTLWDVSLSKAMLPADQLKLSFSVNDLLNQGALFSRSIAGNTISQSSSLSIKRYFMFSLSWDFTKFAHLPDTN